MTGACQAAERHLSRGCAGTFQSAEWALGEKCTAVREYLYIIKISLEFKKIQKVSY